MKKLMKGMIALAMAVGITGCGSSNEKKEVKLEDAKIGVIQLMKHDALDAAYEGFKDVLVEAGVKEENIDYQIAGEQSKCASVAEKLANGDNDLLYAIATPALQAAAASTSDLPIVGCAVTDYESTKLVKSNEKPGGNVTGASDMNPIDAQCKLLTELYPNAKKVGVLYCGSEDNSILQGKMFVKAAKKAGLEPKTYTVQESNQIATVCDKIANDGMEAVYIPTDNLLASNMGIVEQTLSAAKIPTVVGEENMCKQGGVATYGLNYYNLGKLAGQQALDILNGKKTAAETPIAYLSDKDCTLLINMKVAKNCDVDIDTSKYPDATIVE